MAGVTFTPGPSNDASVRVTKKIVIAATITAAAMVPPMIHFRLDPSCRSPSPAGATTIVAAGWSAGAAGFSTGGGTAGTAPALAGAGETGATGTDGGGADGGASGRLRA